MAKDRTLNVNDVKIRVTSVKEDDYICLNDIVANYENGSSLIEQWLRNKNTLEYLAAWESINNPDFNSLEFEGIKNDAGTNRFAISIKQWIEKTNGIGLVAKAGRYGGTYADKDIAFEFAAWLSPTFKLYLIKEFQRLKEIESNEYNLEWNIKRVLTKVNYTIHTDAVKSYIIPNSQLPKEKHWLEYAQEADLLNVALFGYTAKQWKEANPNAALNGANMRDMASLNELTVLSNLESLNSMLISNGLNKEARFKLLRNAAQQQIQSLNGMNFIKSMKHLSPNTYPLAIEEQKKNETLSEHNKALKTALNYNPKEDKE